MLLMTGCSVQKHSSQHSETQDSINHVVVYDTTYVQYVVNRYDTTHTNVTSTVTEKVVEYYDPETGNLRQRVTESEQNVSFLQTQIMTLQEQLDSLNASLVDSLTQIHNQESQEENHVESSSGWCSVGNIILVVIIVLIIAVLIMKNFSFSKFLGL